jgi:hypothetical protein
MAPTTEGDYSLRTGSPCLPAGNACGVRIGALGVGCGPSIRPVARLPESRPRSLRPGHPNPFTDVTTITWDMRKPGPVDLRIFDSAGRLVRELARGGIHGAGRRVVPWDGRDAQGNPVAAGVYYCRLAIDSRGEVRRLVKLP